MASATSYTPFSKCMKGDEFETSPLELRIDGCRESPCILHKGTTMTAEWDFTVSDCAEPHRLEVRVGELLLFVWPYVEFCPVSQLLIFNDRTYNVLALLSTLLYSPGKAVQNRDTPCHSRGAEYICTSLHGCKQRLEGKCGFDENGKLERTYRSSNPSFCRIRCTACCMPPPLLSSFGIIYTVRGRGRLLRAVPLLYNCATGRFQPSAYLVLRSPCTTCTRLHGEENFSGTNPVAARQKIPLKILMDRAFNNISTVTGPRALRAEGASARLRAEPIQCNKYPMTTARGEDFARRLVVARVLTLATRRGFSGFNRTSIINPPSCLNERGRLVYACVLTEVGNTRGPNKARTSHRLRSAVWTRQEFRFCLSSRESNPVRCRISLVTIYFRFNAKFTRSSSLECHAHKSVHLCIAAATGCTARVSFPIIDNYHCRLKRKKRCSKLKLPVESWRKKKKIARCAIALALVSFSFSPTIPRAAAAAAASRAAVISSELSVFSTHRGQRAAPAAAAAIFHSGGSRVARKLDLRTTRAHARWGPLSPPKLAQRFCPSFCGAALSAYYERETTERRRETAAGVGEHETFRAARGAAAVAAAAAADIHTANENSTTMLSMTWAFIKCWIKNLLNAASIRSNSARKLKK
uniref:Uncharacterized protein n=1 Tax=Trichogramma kaykai TaxID=54128 RepID=A0ABD2X047_9HYME